MPITVDTSGLGDGGEPDYYRPLEATVDAGDGRGEREATVQFWAGGLTAADRKRQTAIAERLAEAFWQSMRQHPDYQSWRDQGNQELEWICRQARTLPPPANLAALYGVVHSHNIARQTRLVLRDVFFLVCNYLLLVSIDGRMHAVGPHQRAITLFSPRVEHLWNWSKDVVENVGYVPDGWHQMAALAHLIAPAEAKQLVVFPFWLGDQEVPGHGVTRQAATAIGVPDATEDAAKRYKQEWRKLWSRPPVHAKTGPKTGSTRQPPAERQALERYLLERKRAGVSPMVLAGDAEAQRLYRAARDHAAELNEHIIRDILRRRRQP